MRWETLGGGSAIAGIAVIADIARDRKTRASPLMNTGDTDQESDDRLITPSGARQGCRKDL
jgi:hypothetical protein